MSKDHEIITAYRTEELLHPFNYLKQGYTDDATVAQGLIDDTLYRFKPVNFQRYRLESNAQYQQPIPYVVIIDGQKVLTHTRVECGDERLLHSRSIGFGGHMDFDRDDADINKTLLRELNEELKFDGKKLKKSDLAGRCKAIGILKNWEDDVGAVHVGVIYVFDASGIDISNREKGIVLEWKTIQDLEHDLDLFDQCEMWSQILIRNILGRSGTLWTTMCQQSISRVSPKSMEQKSSTSSSPKKKSVKRVRKPATKK